MIAHATMKISRLIYASTTSYPVWDPGWKKYPSRWPIQIQQKKRELTVSRLDLTPKQMRQAVLRSFLVSMLHCD